MATDHSFNHIETKYSGIYNYMHAHTHARTHVDHTDIQITHGKHKDETFSFVLVKISSMVLERTQVMAAVTSW